MILEKYFYVFVMIMVVPMSLFSQNKPLADSHEIAEKPKVWVFDASNATVSPYSTTIVSDDKQDRKRITLKPSIPQALDGERKDPDIEFSLELPEKGQYIITTYAVTDAEGAELMKKAKGKYESLFMRIQIDDRTPTKRVVYVPWDIRLQRTGKFSIGGSKQQLKIWLPRGVRLEYLEITPEVPPPIPEKAKNYKPTVKPPLTHPRLWVNEQSLPEVRSRLKTGENKVAWEKLEQTALVPYPFKYPGEGEIAYDAKLEQIIEKKAFYYLMTGNETIGREAVDLTTQYLSRVEFGNILDITREVGRAIFISSEVYDWCYDLLEEYEKKRLRTQLMRLAGEMEIGWSPFLQSVVNGHGNEAQVCRDLLAMSIAVYNEDPLPYQYCSYAILETLVPMRKFEYQSSRHNQGVQYGAYRFGWDMHAAWLFKRMAGKPVFDDNIKDVGKFWLYMRSPDGQMFRDGDGAHSPQPGKKYYWGSPQTMLLSYAYSGDSVLKADFQKQGGLPNNPVLFLLLNNPDLKPAKDRSSLPLTHDFGPILGSMVARTGWEFGQNSSDVVAEIKGGGYHFANHQHADAGAIQIYYRGFQLGDLGLYKFYGTPYDINFNKRSNSHSMMLVRDPTDKDPGSRLNRISPKSLEEVVGNPLFKNGKVLSSDFGPSKMKPAFSYFSTDLTSAYSAKITHYKRNFCFLNLGREDIPAAIILMDDIVTSDSSFKKYWQINAYQKPEITDAGMILHNQLGELVGRTHIEMIFPDKNNRTIEILNGEAAIATFDHKYVTPSTNVPEVKAYRVMVSPKYSEQKNQFLTVFQLVAGETKPMPVIYTEDASNHIIQVANRIVLMPKVEGLLGRPFTLTVPAGQKFDVLFTQLKPGKWRISSDKDKVGNEMTVYTGKNTLNFNASGVKFMLSPVN